MRSVLSSDAARILRVSLLYIKPLTRHLGVSFRGRRPRFYLCALVSIAVVATLAVAGYLLFLSGGGQGPPRGEAVVWAPYDWPLKPFDRPHPIRGNFDDPRMPNHHIDGPGPFRFHFGVDISAPGGTAVYAVAPGIAYFDSFIRGRPVAVGVYGKTFAFQYWHIKPAVENGSHVVKRQLLGRVLEKWGHVHLAEFWADGRAVNPLRVGALTPYEDRTKPTIVSVTAYQSGGYLPLSTALSGRFDLVVDVYDTPELKSNWPWAVVTPALIRWRLLSEATGEAAISTRTAIDFRLDEPKVGLSDVFAPGTRQNGSKRAGVYNFWLFRGLDSSELSNGAYELVVLASDIRGNTVEKTFRLTVNN
jgi:hypothetical protein